MITLGFTDIMPIGKYKGLKIGAIISRDAEYILWFDKNVKTHKILPKVQSFAYRKWVDDSLNKDMCSLYMRCEKYNNL